MHLPWYHRMDESGETPMSRACKCGHSELARVMLREDEEFPDGVLDDEASELHLAAYWGLSNAVRKLLAEGADPRRSNIDGDTPLHEAVRNGHKGAVLTLLDLGADVNDENRQGMTCLHWAALNGRADIAEELIERGIDVNRRERASGGLTPRAIAMLMGYDELAELIGSHGGTF